MNAFASVRLTRRFPAPAADVWAALTERDSLARWLVRPQGDVTPGGEFELGLDGVVGAVEAHVRELSHERVLELDWRPPGEPPSVVRIELTEEADETKLVLDHRRLDERVCLRHAARWTRALDRLVALATVEATP